MLFFCFRKIIAIIQRRRFQILKVVRIKRIFGRKFYRKSRNRWNRSVLCNSCWLLIAYRWRQIQVRSDCTYTRSGRGFRDLFHFGVFNIVFDIVSYNSGQILIVEEIGLRWEHKSNLSDHGQVWAFGMVFMTFFWAEQCQPIRESQCR